MNKYTDKFERKTRDNGDKYICLKDLDFAVMKNKIIVTLPREIQNISEGDKLIIEIKE